MKILVVILFCLFTTSSFAQTPFLKEAVSKLDKALLAKDTSTLKQLLHKDVTYGHSNGWVETKEDIIKSMVSGKFSYDKIENKEQKWTVSSDFVTLRSKSDIKYVLDGKPGQLTGHILQVWKKTNKGWQLIARQSAKLQDE